MSPSAGVDCSGLIGFPRVSGDEPPQAFGANLTYAFSPRERG